MAVEYDLYQTPVPGNRAQEERYHARVVNRQTADTTQLAKEIQSRCSLTAGDVKATLEELSQVIAEKLSNGERVHIKGLGFFQMSLQCPTVNNPKEIRAESIRFKSVTFRPEIELKKTLATTTFQRTPVKKHSKKLSDGEIENMLTELFKEQVYLTRAELEQKCGYTRSEAIRRINLLLEEGKLIKKGYRNAPIYLPAPGNFGK